MKSPVPNPLDDLLAKLMSLCNRSLQAKDYEGAWRTLSAAQALVPDSMALRCHHGHLALLLGKQHVALSDFTEVLRVDPHQVDALSGLARYHWVQGELQEAEAAADRALLVEPSNEVAEQVKREIAARRGGNQTRQPDSHDGVQVRKAAFARAAGGGVQARGMVVIKQRGFRRQPVLIDSIAHWGKSRGVRMSVIDHEAFLAGQWGMPADEIGAFYLPITEHYEPMEKVPGRYPVIIDFDANGSSNIATVDVRHLRYAVRNAFGMRVAANRAPDFQVPYVHRPFEVAPSTVRDVVIFDVKTFHGMPAQAAVLALIAGIAEDYQRACAAAQKPLYVYFSSFMPAEPFMQAIDVFVRDERLSKITRNQLREMAQHIIPPVEAMAQYKHVLERCCLFVTEHGDIADIDLVLIGCMGVPIMLYQRLPFFRTTGISMQTLCGAEAIEPRIRGLIENAERLRVKPEWGIERIFSRDRTEPWNGEILENLFMKSWDMLWRWALDGVVDPKVNEAMDTDLPWALGLTNDVAP